MKELYINNRLVDLYPNTIIAQTLQVYDPGKIGSVTTNYTATIKAPRTFENEKTFEYLSNSKSKSLIPYSSLICRYQENGLPMIRNARIVVNEVNQDYALNIYSGPWGFFEFIQLKTLWDLDFSDLNGPWTAAVRDAARNVDTGIVQALVDDGRLVQDQASTAPTIENQGTTVKPPQIYYHTIIQAIFETAGYEYEGDIFTNDIYLKLVMPLSVIYNDTKWLEAKMFFAAAPGDQVMISPASPTAVIFDTNVKQGSDGFYDGESEYVVTNTDTAAYYLRLRLNVDITIEVTGGTVDITLDQTGITPGGAAVETNVGTGNYTLELSTPLKHDDIVKLIIVNNTGTPTVNIIAGTFYTTVITGKEGAELFPSIVEGYVYFQKLFEKIFQTDMLRDFCVRFNVQITQINNKLVVNTLNRILDIRTGPDWTAKRDFRPDRIKWLFANYGKNNTVKAPVDDEFTPDLTDAYGDGDFQIPNENLKETLNIYSGMFAVSEMVSTFGVFMLKLNLGPDFANFARMPGKRLFFVRDNYDYGSGVTVGEPPVLYDTVDRTDYKVGYYFDPSQTYEMSWQFFLDQFHQKYIDRCLRKVRLIERLYNLSDLDIFSFNQQVPIWDNGERFLVTKIINRVTRKLAKTELLKIESNPENFSIFGTVHEITGELEDTMEVMGDSVPPELEVRLELIEGTTGSPTWQCTYNNTQDSVVSTAIGNGASDTDVIDHVGSLNVTANVLKTNNDGFGPDGFPTMDGWVEWLRNGVQVNTELFNTASNTSSQGLDFTYTAVSAFEILRVVVHEDGTSP